jgi:hypothetical protein
MPYRRAGAHIPSVTTSNREGTMNTNENAEIVRRGYEAFNNADIDTLAELMDENASWHTPGRSPIAGDYLVATPSSRNSASTGVTRAAPSRPS